MSEVDADNDNAALRQRLRLPWENPFLNELVLERFFQLCSSEDLSRFRLVSKQWFSESLTRFRNEMVVEIRQSAGSPSEAVTVWKDLTDQRTAGESPFRSFRLRDFHSFQFLPKPADGNVDEVSVESREDFLAKVDAFWTSYGPCINKLELVSCTGADMDSFKKVVFEGTPNLKELHLISFKSSPPQCVPNSIAWRLRVERVNGVTGNVQQNLEHLRIKLPCSFPTTFRYLLLHCPKLQTLEIDNIVFSMSKYEMDFLDELLIICEERRGNEMFPCGLITFTNVVFRLKLPVPVRTDRTIQGIITILRLLQPRLMNATIEFDIENWREEEMSLLSEIFRYGGAGMKELILKVSRVFGNELERIRNFPFEMGPYDSVTKLHLTGNICSNLHFLEEFPNLEELRLEITRSDEMLQGTDWTRMGSVVLLKLKQFQYFDDCPHVPIPGEVIGLFRRMMLNLEYLEVPLTNSLLRDVCRDWTGLRELHTDCDNMRDEDKIDDAGVTGILAGADGEGRLPNITDMKHLEHLSLRNLGRSGDLSVHEGFLKMQHLKNLNVDLEETSYYESFLNLVKRFPKGKISRYHPGHDPPKR